jgi:conjugative relaxase-like TrwC/TraI family protein
MLTARPQKSLEAAKNYFREHLTKGEYHSEGHTIVGHWFGLGAQRLGLEPGQPVTQEAYERLCENRNPLTGEQLTVRQRQVDRRIFHDVVVSAPKSVSIMAEVIGDARLCEAHLKAAHAAMAAVEAEAGTRVRRDGSNTTRVTGEVTAAAFTHHESRALDPQLHTHFVVFNATWDAVENCWKALQTERIFERMTFFTEVYRSELARRVQALGYAIRPSKHGFELAAVNQNIIARFSKRSHTIREKEAQLESELGKPVSNNTRAAIARASRPKKLRGLGREELRSRQCEQLSPQELDELRRAVPGSIPAVVPKSEISVDAAIDYARDHLFERHSVAPTSRLLGAALAYARGSITLPELKEGMDARTDFIHVGDEVTTHDMLDLETRMIAMVNEGMGQERPLNLTYRAAPYLNQDQATALRRVLGSPDWVIAVRGGAGTGKSTLLKEIVQGIAEHRACLVLAPSTAAVAALRGDGLPRALTVQRYLIDENVRADARDSVLIIDEAGLLSSTDMSDLLNHAQRHRCRVVLSGDTRQHTAVQAGDALRILEKKSALIPVAVHQIVRQVQHEYREAIAAFSCGNGSEAIRRLEKLGAVQELDEESRYRVLASAYVNAIREGKSALAVSPTWREIEAVTSEIRDQLKAAGRLGPVDTTVQSHHSLKWTLAQKRDLRNYQTGHILLFHRATQKVNAGEFLKVEKVSKSELVAARGDGSVVVLTAKQAGCFEVAETLALPVAPGESLLLQATARKHRLFNGQLVTVQTVHPDGAIALTDGRIIPKTFRTFTHGYCVTSHASQGRTVDRVFVAVDSHTLIAAHLNQFYVSCSRGRQQVAVYTDDREFLHRAVGRSAERTSATELVETVNLQPALKARPRARIAA